VHPLDERRRRIGSGPLELFHPGEDRGLMDPSWGGGLKGSPSAKEGMPLSALLPVAGLGLAAKAGPAVMRGGQAAVAGADKVSDFVVELMRVYKTLPPDKKNLAWRIIQEVIAKEVIQGSADSPDKSAEKQKGTVGYEEPVEFDPTGRLLEEPPGLGPVHRRATDDIRRGKIAHYSPSQRAIEKTFAESDKETVPGHMLQSAIKKGGGLREMELTDSVLDKNTKYTLKGALESISPLKIGRHQYDENKDPALNTAEALPGSGKWDRLGFRTIENRPEEFFRLNPRRFLHRNPTQLTDTSLSEGGFPPESQPGGVTAQRHEGGAFGYKETLFTSPIPKFLTESPVFTEVNRDFSTGADGIPEDMDFAGLPKGDALKNLFPNHVYWSPELEQHWPGEFNIIAHLRSDIRIIDGEYSVFGDEFQSDWQTEHDEALSGLKLLNFVLKDPEKFFSLDYDGFVESGISGDVLKFLGRDEREREGKSLNEYYTILQDKYGIGVALIGDAGEDLVNIIEGSDEALDNPDLFDLSEATPLAKIAWDPGYEGPLGGELVDIKETLRKRYQALGNVIEKSNVLGSGDIDWHDIADDNYRSNILQTINQAMEDLPKSPYARTKDWTKLIAEQQLLTAANEGYNSISWSSGDLKIKTNPGELSEAKLRLIYDKEMKDQVIRSLRSLGVSKEDIDIQKVPYNVLVPTERHIARMWPSAETYVWKLNLTPEIIDLIMKKGFKVSQLDPSKGGLLGQERKRELYA
jgi:hypothetical protein